MEKANEKKKWNRIYAVVVIFLCLQILAYYLFTLKFR